jgi:threonine/homoserine/homoserine lactone efflux protein
MSAGFPTGSGEVTYLSLILFVIATCGSPGPNNIMIMSSGVTYGARRSIPHVVGINVGFPLMTAAVGLGLGGVLRGSPILYDILRPAGAAYLLYLAYRIATGPVTVDQARSAKPLSMLQAALFQLVNPKAWVMIVGAVLTYATASGSYLVQILLIALVFLVFGTPCTSFWLWLGVALKRVLAKPAQFRAFNVTMATLLVFSIIPIFVEIYRSFIT